MRFYSPLRYPGGKGKLAPYIHSLIEANNMHHRCYVEPYAGGAGVALHLLFSEVVSEIIINDLDKHVHAFWWAVLNDCDALCKQIFDTPVTMDVWTKQKQIYVNPDNFSLAKLGFSTFFLNRTNRSGILTGGVIGGMQQLGKYPLHARFNKTNLITRIEKIAKHSHAIHLYNEDAQFLTQRLVQERKKEYFFYFDPPYFQKGQCLYKNAYIAQDHWDMAVLIQSLSCPWIVTYDRQHDIEEMYAGVDMHYFDIAYSSHKERVRGKEVLYYKNLQAVGAPYTRELDRLQMLAGI